MSDFVLDASVSLSWFVDQPIPDLAREAREHLLKGKRAIVPTLWIYEMANGFVTAERRQVLAAGEVGACCDEMEIMLANSVEVTTPHRKGQVHDLALAARKHSLTGYDASYLELALIAGLPLVTLDQSLHAAARKAGLPSFP